MRGHDDDRQIRVIGSNLRHQFESGHSGHLDVCYHDIGSELSYGGPGLERVGDRQNDTATTLLQNGFCVQSYVGIVLDDNHAKCVSHGPILPNTNSAPTLG